MSQGSESSSKMPTPRSLVVARAIYLRLGWELDAVAPTLDEFALVMEEEDQRATSFRDHLLRQSA